MWQRYKNYLIKGGLSHKKIKVLAREKGGVERTFWGWELF
jgi:hypothetical protein